MSMASRVILLAALAALAPVAGAAQACPDPAAITAGVARPLAAVRYLADDALEGRLAGSPGERCAGDYIAAEFRRLGLEPTGDSGTYFQAIPLASALDPHAPGGTGRNVLARLPGADPALAGEVVIVGAHYDHLGHGGRFSMATGDSSVHNGADDNASGVAALLEIAGLLARGPRPARTVLFMAFSGEEMGLLGSAAYTRAPVVPLERTRAMLNLDMVGRLRDQPLIVYGVETADEWRDAVGRAAAAEGVEVRMGGDGFGASDHAAFYVRDIPVLHFFTNVHDDYHRPTDDWQKIDAAGITKVAAVVAAVARDVAGRPAALTLRRAPPPAPRGVGGGYGAYLGSIPDFTPVPFGVKLSGVRAGSPAEQAGLKAGDVIIGFDEEPITDLQAMTDALRARKPGDAVRIKIQRGDQEMVLNAVLGTRGGG